MDKETPVIYESQRSLTHLKLRIFIKHDVIRKALVLHTVMLPATIFKYYRLNLDNF